MSYQSISVKWHLPGHSPPNEKKIAPICRKSCYDKSLATWPIDRYLAFARKVPDIALAPRFASAKVSPEPDIKPELILAADRRRAVGDSPGGAAYRIEKATERCFSLARRRPPTDLAHTNDFAPPGLRALHAFFQWLAPLAKLCRRS